MPAKSAFDYATPFDIMVGLWAKQSIIYGPGGDYIDSVPGLVAVYWKKPGKLIHFREELLTPMSSAARRHIHRPRLFELTRQDFDLKVKGKVAATSSKMKTTVVGIEARPDVYHFHLHTPDGHWYNNHHCITPNERHILGPLVPADGDGSVELIVAQTLTRISYDVPRKSKRELRR